MLNGIAEWLLLPHGVKAGEPSDPSREPNEVDAVAFDTTAYIPPFIATPGETTYAQRRRPVHQTQEDQKECATPGVGYGIAMRTTGFIGKLLLTQTSCPDFAVGRVLRRQWKVLTAARRSHKTPIYQLTYLALLFPLARARLRRR